MRPLVNTWVNAFYYNLITPGWHYVLSNGLRTEEFAARAWFLRLLEVSVLRSEHLINHKKQQIKTLDIRGISKKIKRYVSSYINP